MACCSSFRHFCHRIIYRERVWFLDGWEFLEGFCKLPCSSLCCVYEISVVNHPVPVRIRSGIRKFVRIGTQIEHFWNTKSDEGLSPHLQCSLATLFHEYQLPIVVAYAKHISIVTEIKVNIAGTCCYFTCQIRKQI